MEILHDITDYPPFNTIDDDEVKQRIRNDFSHEIIPAYTLIITRKQTIERIGCILKGSIDFLTGPPDGKGGWTGSLYKGDYFGIEALFDDGLALSDELTMERVECFVIEKENFFKILVRYSQVNDFFKAILNEKLKKHMGPPLGSVQQDHHWIDNKDTARIRKALQYIDANYMTHITLDDAADMTGLSRFHFSRMFKSATGHTFKEYLNIKRLSAAKRLLRFPEINISQACFSVGFNDVSYFSRIFKKYEGMNPALYKKVHLKNA